MLAWIDAGNGSYQVAAKHFGLSISCVKHWVQRRPQRGPSTAPSLTVASSGRTPVVEGGAAAPHAKPPLARGKQGVVALDAVAPEVRAQLRDGARRLSGIIAGIGENTDMRQIDAAARALRTLLEIAPGLASFEATTGDTTSKAGPTDEDAALLESAMFPPEEPPVLTVVEARRA